MGRVIPISGMLPCRTALDSPETSRRTPVRNLLARIDTFKARTGFRFSAPYNNPSGKWQAFGPAGMTEHDNGHRMMDELEAKYPE